MSGLGNLLETSPDLRWMIEVLTQDWLCERGAHTIINVHCVLNRADGCEEGRGLVDSVIVSVAGASGCRNKQPRAPMPPGSPDLAYDDIRSDFYQMGIHSL